MNAVSSLRAGGDASSSNCSGEVVKLRVLSGRSEGAEYTLPQDRKLLVGHSFENDVVIRDGSTRGHSLELTTCGKRAVLKVLSGSARMLGRDFGVDETVILERYIPLHIGDIVFAIGHDDDDRWDDALENALNDPTQAIAVALDTQRTDVAERLELRSTPIRERLRSGLLAPRAFLIAGGLLFAVGGGAFAGSLLLPPAEPSRGQLASELISLGYTGLTVEETGEAGQLAIVGLVDNDETILELRQWAETNHPDIALGVATLESAAEDATNLLAAQNIDAKVVPDGQNRLLIETPFLPRDRVAELEQMLRNDLPRVRAFGFESSADRGESDLAYFFNAPGYGAASFVSGDPGFIVTEDGTRWFSGATLPTGHTIIEISDNSVTLERGGIRDTLTM